ncbi:MAG: hypothetical protein GXP19_02155 [Gammaproteobacteria bacterium]|nr:hypothetical protein [Gammaproteobacteria bacterium]
MPYLKIQTNVSIDIDQKNMLLSKASQLVAEILSKPEKYVIAVIENNPSMLFDGKNDPLAYLELKSIGLPETKTSSFSQALCDLIYQELNINKDRIYIEFSNADRHMWGWNGATF